MCFSSKVKTPKTNPDALKAPEPVLIDEPKGVDFGASEDDQSTDTGVDSLTVKKDSTSDKGDGSSSATATDTGVSKVKTASAPVKRAIKKVTK
ncbi:putative virion protein [Pseudomonas phage MR2]|uniref:Putative virion protein n=1 Tax=Pseudomonas phage MR2 TaxID=2711170 RepID=A0A6M3T8W6_9CAUD|nr:putative virion protein [Pseudomonas phage MR2]